MDTDTVETWFEVEVRLAHQENWRRTTALVGGIKDGFPTPTEAQDFIDTMTDEVSDLLYRDASWRIVRCERRVMTPARHGTTAPTS